MRLSLRRDQTRIPLLGAFASLLFLATLALIARAALRRVTFADLDDELQTLSVAIGSDLELQGIGAVQHATLRAGVESNTLAFRLQRHSAILFDKGQVIALAGDLIRQPIQAAAASFARRPEGTFTAVEPFSGLGWHCRFRVAHLSGAAAGATLIIFRSIDPTMRALQRVDLALVLFVVGGVIGSWAIIAIAVRRALRPVEMVTSIAEKSDATDMSRRVAVTTGGEEIERLTGVINSLFERLGRSFEAQRRFVADAAHELKTPAAAILAEAQEAMRSDTPAEQRSELLQSIAASARSLAAETNDLLTLARAESSQRTFIPFDLADVARAAIQACQPLAREKKIEIALSCNGDLTLLADRVALETTIENLVSNAVQYSDPGTRVDVSVRDDRDNVVIEVADQGPGIDPQDRERIFDRFVRLPHARRVSPSGSGLGLAIVAQAVRNHDGVLAVRDSPAGGALFSVVIPRQKKSA